MTLSAKERAALIHRIDAAWRGEDRFFVRNDGHLYKPSKGQLKFHDSEAWARGLFGGRGSGKTGAGAQESLDKVRQGKSGIIANPDFENLKIATWPELKKWIPWNHVVPHDQRMKALEWEPRGPFTIHFDNGVTVWIKGIKDPESARGPNVNWFWYDESGRDKKDESFKIAAAGVRIGDDPRVFTTSTPKGIRHWLYKYFVIGELSDKVKKELKAVGFTGQLVDHAFCSIHDNRHNLSEIFYASMLSLYEGKFALQELDGQFIEIAEGVVFDNFTPDNITRAEPVPGVPIELAFDDGYIDPRVVLFIQRFSDRVLVFDEYYRSHELEETTVKKVVERINEWPWQLSDKDRKHHTARVIQSKIDRADEEGERGIVHVPVNFAIGSPEKPQLHKRFRNADITVRAKPHKILDGIAKVRRIICDVNQKRVLQVHPRCKQLLSEITDTYRYPEEARRDSENPLDENDHGCEALRHWVWLRIS